MRRELLTLLLLLAPLTLGASEPQAVNRPPLPAQVVDGKPRTSISTPKSLPPAVPSQPTEWAAIAPVKAISGIDGELKIKAGGFFVLKPNGTADGKGVVWFVHPKPARKEVFKTKLPDGAIVPIFVFSGSESEYAVTMVVVAGEDTTQYEATAIVEGVVPPAPPVPPGPTPPPAPTGLAAKVAELANAVNRPTRAAEAKALAGAFKSMQAAIGAGVIKSIEDLQGKTYDATHAALTSPVALEWRTPFFAPLKAELDKLNPPTVQAAGEIYGQIATGLESVR